MEREGAGRREGERQLGTGGDTEEEGNQKGKGEAKDKGEGKWNQ